MKVGDLVQYIPSPSATFKWEKYTDAFKALPGVVIREVEAKCTKYGFYNKVHFPSYKKW